MACRAWLVLVSVAFAGMPASAKVSISLPLEGFYRVGRYMPVRFEVDEPSAHLLAVSSPGCARTQVMLSAGQGRGIAPLLPIEPTRQIQWQLTDAQGRVLSAGTVEAALRQLGPDQRIVGMTRVDLELARALFDGESVIPVRLNGADLSAVDPGSWNVLDGIVLDSAEDVGPMMPLLAGGLTLAVRSDSRPKGPWPWEPSGSLWLIRPNLLGPRYAGAYLDAFTPVQGWAVEWPAALRRRILLIAAAFCILVLGLSLFRWRWISLVIAAAAILAAAGLWAMWKDNTVVTKRQASIEVRTRGLVQRDLWTYIASATPGEASVEPRDLLLPFFQFSSDWLRASPAVVCLADGRMQRIRFRLQPGVKVACVARTMAPWVDSSPLDMVSPDQSMLLPLARRAYLRSGYEIAGQAVPNPDMPDWALPLVIRQLPQTPATRP